MAKFAIQQLFFMQIFLIFLNIKTAISHVNASGFKIDSLTHFPAHFFWLTRSRDTVIQKPIHPEASSQSLKIGSHIKKDHLTVHAAFVGLEASLHVKRTTSHETKYTERITFMISSTEFVLLNLRPSRRIDSVGLSKFESSSTFDPTVEF